MNGTKDTKKNLLYVNASDRSAKKSVPRQKVLLPTLKEQQRYAVYAVLTDTPQKSLGDFLSVHNNIIQQCNAFLGVFDGGRAGLQSVKFNPSKAKGVIRVDNRYVDKLKVCLGLIKTVNDVPVTVDCVSVSGMLNKAVDKMNG